MSRVLIALAIPLSLVLAACGEATAPGDPGAPGEWQTQRLSAEVGADQAPLLGTSGDDALVLTVAEDGTLLSHLSTGGARFEAGEPLSTDAGWLQLGDVVALPDGDWLALGSGGETETDGDTELLHDPLAFRSADGLVWEQVEVTGFDQHVDINDVEVAGETVVVAGAYRTAEDPSSGGFEAHVWTSADGASFTQVDLPDVTAPRGYRNESHVAHLAVAGDRLLVGGRLDDSAALWTSTDDGGTWQRVADPVLDDTYDLSGLVAVGDVVVASVAEGSVTALRSSDAGATWEPVEALPTASEEVGWAPAWADQERFWTLTGIDDMSWSRPEVCYADLDQCGRSPGPRPVTSTDGAAWSGVELPGEPETITGTANGRVLALTVDGEGVAVHTLEPGVSPPAAPEETEPRTVDLVTLEEGERGEVGVRYHAPMYVHCGMDWFWFGDGTWRRTDDGPDVETGAGDDPPEGWAVVGQVLYGHATLTDADHLDYSFGDQVVATYRRAEGAPGCD
ncbi:WD40/YVTN/BNR-like repeat-containing protein [Nocardioides pacificus]